MHCLRGHQAAASAGSLQQPWLLWQVQVAWTTAAHQQQQPHLQLLQQLPRPLLTLLLLAA
jgi:hypothetical protein